MNWIKYKDQMPPDNGRYLVVKKYFGRREVDVSNYAKDLYQIDKFDFYENAGPGWYEYDDEYGYYQTNFVTHWALLPDLPAD